MITRSQLETVLEAWRMEYGYGECSELAPDDIADVRTCGRPVQIGTLADEFHAAWVRLCGGNSREFRMAMALKADTFASSSDPLALILDRMRLIGIRMVECEFRDHVGWARAHFLQVLTIKRAA